MFSLAPHRIKFMQKFGARIPEAKKRERAMNKITAAAQLLNSLRPK